MDTSLGDSELVSWGHRISVNKDGISRVMILIEVEPGGNKEEKELDIMYAFSELYADVLEEVDI